MSLRGASAKPALFRWGRSLFRTRRCHAHASPSSSSPSASSPAAASSPAPTRSVAPVARPSGRVPRPSDGPRAEHPAASTTTTTTTAPRHRGRAVAVAATGNAELDRLLPTLPSVLFEAGAHVHFGYNPVDCCHAGGYNPEPNDVWVSERALASTDRLTYVTVHELAHSVHLRTPRAAALTAAVAGAPVVRAGPWDDSEKVADCVAWVLAPGETAASGITYWDCPGAVAIADPHRARLNTPGRSALSRELLAEVRARRRCRCRRPRTAAASRRRHRTRHADGCRDWLRVRCRVGRGRSPVRSRCRAPAECQQLGVGLDPFGGDRGSDLARERRQRRGERPLHGIAVPMSRVKVMSSLITSGSSSEDVSQARESGARVVHHQERAPVAQSPWQRSRAAT